MLPPQLLSLPSPHPPFLIQEYRSRSHVAAVRGELGSRSWKGTHVPELIPQRAVAPGHREDGAVTHRKAYVTGSGS